jgi:hypothetical protein
MLQNQVLDTDKFKKYAADKKLVLCRIDVDDNPGLARQYQATAIPLQVVANERGSVIKQNVGYGAPNDFYAFLDSALGGG